MKEKSHIQKTKNFRGKVKKKTEEIQFFHIFFSLYSTIIIIITLHLFLLILLEKLQHAISGCHYSHHDMVNSSYTNAFDNKNYSG